MSVVTILGKQSAEGVLHGAGGRGVHVGLDRRQVYDVLANEIIGDADAFGVDVVESQHFCLRLVRYPGHVFFTEVVAHGNGMPLEDRHVTVQIFALKSIGDHGLILDAHQVLETCLAQRQDAAF